jgi:predicted transposase/invertase (TIGR01784 family)
MSQDYDKIFKENIASLLPALVHRVLGLHLWEMEMIPLDVQLTIERRPDFILRGQLAEEEAPFLLQIEFQTSNESDMAERMLEYAALLRRKHGLPLRQYVLYIGNEAVRMPTEISESDLWFRFHLINLKEFDYQTFLQAEQPEEIILSVLCHYRGHAPSDVIHQILLRLKELANQGIRIDKYVQQLEMLSNLRNLHEETVFQTKKMAITYDLTKDLRYQEGVEKGMEKGETKGKLTTLQNFLRSKPFRAGLLSYEDLASATGFSVEEVRAIHQRLLAEDENLS